MWTITFFLYPLFLDSNSNHMSITMILMFPALVVPIFFCLFYDNGRHNIVPIVNHRMGIKERGLRNRFIIRDLSTTKWPLSIELWKIQLVHIRKRHASLWFRNVICAMEQLNSFLAISYLATSGTIVHVGNHQRKQARTRIVICLSHISNLRYVRER